MIRRRRTISSGCTEEAMEESLAEQSPTTMSTRKRKRLDPVILHDSSMTYLNSTLVKTQIIC